jgi:hypothetical protein
MLARHELHGNSRRLLPATQTKHATQFMFIDSSNGGVNAKPDKVVRSFVMKSARNKKSWSTRPRSPKTDLSSDVKTRWRSSSRKHSMTEHGATNGSLSRPDCTQPWASRYNSSMISSHSSQSGSTFSCQDSACACHSAISCSTSPYAEYIHEDDVFACAPWQQEMSMHRNDLRLASLGSFDCLVVDLDISAEHLLHRCKKLVA